MKETRIITIDPERYKELLEYSQRIGQPVKEAINEALDDYIASSEKAREIQGQ
jgi:Ribbon-helix-helix domain